jgi:hypothetical protein
MRLLTSLLAGVTLAVGFGVAQVTGNRPVGGVVLVVGAAVCGYQWWQMAGPLPTFACEFVFFAAFIASHPLAKQMGAWPAVAVVGVAAVVISYVLTTPRVPQRV